MKKNILIFILFINPMLFQHGVYANEGLDLDLAILKINKEVKSLNNEILSLKDEIELIKEEQRISSAKIAELRQIIELNLSNTKQEKKSTKKIHTNTLNGVILNKIQKNKVNNDVIKYSFVNIEIDRVKKVATISILAPNTPPPKEVEEIYSQGDQFWLLKCARELDDAILYLRFNELEIGIILFKTIGKISNVLSYDKLSL